MKTHFRTRKLEKFRLSSVLVSATFDPKIGLSSSKRDSELEIRFRTLSNVDLPHTLVRRRANQNHLPHTNIPNNTNPITYIIPPLPTSAQNIS